MSVPRWFVWVALVLAQLAQAPPITAQVPHFETTTCDYPVPAPLPRDIRRECGYLIVPQDRARPEGRTFRLAVVRYPAREPDGSPPLLLLHGGPDGDGGTRVGWGAAMQLPLARRRTVVSFDMRGVSASDPHICPRFDEDARAAFLRRTRKDWEEGYRAAVRACVATLEGLDRSAFGADVNAEDAIDLRRAFGYTVWDVYGVSHGGMVAQEIMRRDPNGVRASVLVSAPAPGDYASEWALSYQRYMHYVFDTCAAQPECRSAFPTLEQDFYALYEELSATPREVPVPGTSPPRTVVVNGERFLMHVRQALSPPSVTRLPLLINDLRRGDRETAFRRLVRDGTISPWGALGRLVQCNEYGAAYRADVAALASQYRAPFLTIADDFREHCDQWLSNPTHPIAASPIVSSIPTLVTHGEYDPSMDPAATQRKITVGLSRAYAYTFPGEGHAGPPIGCHGSIVQQFLENPGRPPDSSCIARMRPVRFTTAGFGPTLTLIISTATNDNSPFAGTWETMVGVGSDSTIELELDGQLVRGTALEQSLPIAAGSVNGSTLSFRFRSPDGGRMVTFTGMLEGDALHFTRTVETLPGGGTGRGGIFGAQGPGAFTARKLR